MRDAYDVSWAFRLSLIVIVVCFLILIGGYPIRAIPYAAHDDALFFRGLENLLHSLGLLIKDVSTSTAGI